MDRRLVAKVAQKNNEHDTIKVDGARCFGSSTVSPGAYLLFGYNQMLSGCWAGVRRGSDDGQV